LLWVSTSEVAMGVFGARKGSGCSLIGGLEPNVGGAVSAALARGVSMKCDSDMWASNEQKLTERAGLGMTLSPRRIELTSVIGDVGS
jgi:hypothetical protein